MMAKPPPASTGSPRPRREGAFAASCDVVTGIFLAVLSACLLAFVVSSLKWRMGQDAPLYVYAAYLMRQLHYLPYRDIYDVNAPGVFLFNQAYVWIFGYDDLGFRCADLICLVAILTSTWFWLKRVGRRVAWGAVVLFGIVYLGYGPPMSMQRDYVAILPISLAILLASSYPRLNDMVRCPTIGMLFGLAALIKPHAAIGFPAVLYLGLVAGDARGAGRRSRGVRARLIAASLVGLVVPSLAAIFYLWRHGALPAFWEIATLSWPQYVQLTRYHEILEPGPWHALYLMSGFLAFGGQAPWLFTGLVGVFAALEQPTVPRANKALIIVIGVLTLSYGVYPVFGGKFWDYHWIIFTYMAIALSSLCLVSIPTEVTGRARLLPLLTLALAISVQVRPPMESTIQVMGWSLPAPKDGRVDEIATFLRSRLRPGDLVQPLDWTGGAVHAMLIARARLATRYLYDEEFYHHVSTPYVQRLRREFVRDLQASGARFVIDIATDKPWVSGFDTTTEFPELRQLLAAQYTMVFKGKGYSILEKRPA